MIYILKAMILRHFLSASMISVSRPLVDIYKKIKLLDFEAWENISQGKIWISFRNTFLMSVVCSFGKSSFFFRRKTFLSLQFVSEGVKTIFSRFHWKKLKGKKISNVIYQMNSIIKPSSLWNILRIWFQNNNVYCRFERELNIVTDTRSWLEMYQFSVWFNSHQSFSLHSCSDISLSIEHARGKSSGSVQTLWNLLASTKSLGKAFKEAHVSSQLLLK